MALAAVGTYCLGDGLPLVQTAHPDFVGSGDCATCHSSLQDEAGLDVSIDAHWRSTMMANSAKDPLWQAKVSSEVEREPALQAVIEDKCATCHMPMARTQAKALDLPVAILGEDGFLDPDHALHDLAMDGVSCAVCHQITDEGLGEQSSFSGGYTIDTSTRSPDRLIYGPYANPFINQMVNNVGFTPVQGAHLTQSELCGTCHTLETPYVDATGAVLGSFPEQMTYLEWEHSAYNADTPSGRECQDCHMPQAQGGVLLSNRGGPGLNLEARSPFSQHHFVGGNSFMLGLMSENLEALQLTASTQHFEDTRLRLISQMQSDTGSLSLTSVRGGGRDMEVGLLVRNEAGHKFPSGFPSRRAWLHFVVRDGRGEIVFESGRPDAAGRIAGNDADLIEGGCEPHYDLLTSPDQVQIYESVMENTDGEVTYTLLRGARYRKDNRLLPLGFDLATADERIGVAGEAVADANFTGGQDELRFRVPTLEGAGPFQVEVRLLYQSVSAAFVMDLRKDSTELVERFGQMYDQADQTPLTVASLSFSVDATEPYELAIRPLRRDHGPELVISGPEEGALDLETSTDLLNWQVLETIQRAAGPQTYEDTQSDSAEQRFYQLRWPLPVTTQ